MRGAAPRQLCGNLYVRTTKTQLGLPKPHRHFVPVEINPGQTALYAIVRSEALKQLSSLKSERRIDIYRAQRSVMTLLQLLRQSSPGASAMSEVDELSALSSGIIDPVIAEGPSRKMREVGS